MRDGDRREWQRELILALIPVGLEQDPAWSQGTGVPHYSRVLQSSRVWGILASHHGIDGVEWEAAMHRGLHLGSAEFLWGVLGG